MFRKNMLTKRVLSLAVVTALSLGTLYGAPSQVEAARRGNQQTSRLPQLSQTEQEINSLNAQIKDLEKQIKAVRNDRSGKKTAKLRAQIEVLENEIKALQENNEEVVAPQAPVEEVVVPEEVYEEEIVPEIVPEEVYEEEEVQLQSGNRVDVKAFGVKGDANYYNPSNGNYYVDSEFNTPATDDTKAINEAVQYASQNGIKEVYIPSGSYLIDPEGKSESRWQRAFNAGIQLESNMSLIMENDTTIVTNTVFSNGYGLISLNHKENVEIIGGNLVGDINTHPADGNGAMHDYCYGITIANASKNVLVKDVNITQMEDDGIMIVDYTEDLSYGERTRNIEIRNVKSHNNGRQGLSITAGTDIKVIDSEFSNQRKHLPMSGIDIELESYNFLGVENVEIIGNTFDNNAFAGVVVSDMFNNEPGSMSKNIKISQNEFNNNRFGAQVSGKVDGLEISSNNVNIDHLVNEFSTAFGTTSEESKNVSITNNTAISTNRNNYSTGITNMTENTVISNNTLTGQRISILSYSGDPILSGNMIADFIDLGIHIL